MSGDFKERSANKQLAINMIASLSTFVIGLGVRFFLTPYIVGTLGREAYGFIGLAANILSYTGLITIALNSMAGRFVAVKYTAGDVDGANKYYSSVFFSNIVLAGFTLLFAIGCIVYLEQMINIPPHLVFDVKFLFCFLAVNNIVGLITGIWGVSTFIKNRLDLANIRGIIGNFINAAILVCLFTFLSPHIWYMGIAGLVMTAYVAITNKGFSNLLTPDLRVRLSNYEFSRVIELVKAGAWNLVTKLGSILGHELDLIIANVFIGTSVMGQFAMTKGIPFLILSLFQTISGVFAPNFTALYAQGRRDELISEIRKSMRILSLFSAIPLACLYFYGKEFYGLWLPTEDAGRLQLLTILGTFALPYTLPLESLWSVFTITNKLKYSSIFAVIDNVVVFVVVMSCMYVLKTPESRILALASTRSICGIVRGFVFLPLYGAHCLELPLTIFYKTIFRSLLYISICFVACYGLRYVVVPTSWIELIMCGLLVMLLCIIISVVVVLTKTDREFIFKRLLKR